MIKKEKISQKPYLADYNLLTVQDLWHAHYQTLLIILLTEFIKVNVNLMAMIKYVKLAAFNTEFVSAFFVNDLIEYKCICCNKNYKKKGR